MENSVIDPLPAPVAGMAWRPVTVSDLDALVALAGACYATDGGLGFLNEPDNLRERYFPGAPATATGAFDGDGRLVAFAIVSLFHEPERQRAVILGQVHPDFRRRGAGDALMRWSIDQANALFESGGAPDRLIQIVTETLTGTGRRLYEKYGFEPRHDGIVMRRDLSPPLPDRPLPPDVTLSTWEPALEEPFFRAYHDAFRERPGFPGYSAEEWIGGYHEAENTRADWCLLARAGEAPAGFVTAEDEHPGGFVVQVGVVPGWRRRGLAAALLVETMRRMRDAGKPFAELTVNLDNPGAIEAYRAIGFTTVGHRGRFNRPAP